jgi:gluconolactonase
MPLINIHHAQSFVEGLDHPEGVALGRDGHLYAGGEGGQVYRIDINSRAVRVIGTTKGLNLGLALDGDHNIYVCNPGDGAVKRVTPAGEVTDYSRGNAGRAMITPNYPAFDGAGNLYVTDSGAWKADNGCIWCITPDGESIVIDTENPEFPNGCAVSPDGRYLYVAMSLNPPRVIRFPIENGRKAGPTEVVADLPHTVPDGLAFCADGSYLVSCYRPDTIFRVFPDGSLTVLIDDYEGTLLGGPTNVCFGGPERSVLFWGNLGRWHIGYHEHTGLTGAPLFYPHLK